MATTQEIALMAAIEELAPGTMPPAVLTQLEALLKRKLENIPEHILLSFTIYDVLHQAPQMLVNPYVPTDIQLPFILRNHSSMDRDKGRPIKSERQQDLDITRAIFFYHRHEAYQFQRYHDTSRWNLAFFTALLCDEPAPPTSTSHDHSSSDSDDSFHARTFMISYLAAVMERHNTPTTFEKREDFVRHWKWSDWDLFTGFASGQRRVLKREMSRLTKEWERELDKAKRNMGRDEYDMRVAPFVGSVIPGRKDQWLMRGVEHLQGWSISDSQSEDVDVEVSRRKREELIGALCVPVEEERYGDDEDYGEDGTTPTDLSDAITWMQSTRPAEILPVLMRLFPAGE